MEGKQDLVIGKQVLDIQENRFYSKKTRNKKQFLDHPQNLPKINNFWHGFMAVQHNSGLSNFKKNEVSSVYSVVSFHVSL